MSENLSENTISWLYSTNPTDDELYQIYSVHPKDDNIVKLLKNEEGNGLFILRDEAFGMYWNRKLKSLDRKLIREEISQLLQYIEFPCAKGTIGEAAVLDLLSREECEELIQHFEPGDWAYVQLKARILVSNLDDSMKADDKQTHVLHILEELILLKHDLWAIKKVLNYMNVDKLLQFKERLLSDKSLLNKGNRHYLRENIDNILKQNI